MRDKLTPRPPTRFAAMGIEREVLWDSYVHTDQTGLVRDDNPSWGLVYATLHAL